MRIRNPAIAAVGTGTFLWATQIAPTEFSKDLSAAGLIVLGLWLAIMAGHSALDFLERGQSIKRGGSDDRMGNSERPVVAAPTDEGDEALRR